ncbi:peroxisomal membrane protein Pex14p [[Candida] railenensis]|uniref:Peroxisomal membrane protein PEX14 n=1 Tax=[Candida] railenensis TaxID=45579 RepID=A0A9P0QNK4_9ASCO|nr:peroxisomal membrane protein Pex14p [[Candida] railenensis]
MNEELIGSAVSFLKDPNVGSSPLTKKIEFLESKGLSQQEIEEALRRANGEASDSNAVSNASSHHNSNSAGNSSSVAPNNSNVRAASYVPPIDYYNVQPQVPERSWKDYFIMATATAGVTYGVYQVLSRYLIPSILPPTQSSIEQDKAKIDEEFTKIDKLLEQLAEDQSEMKKSNTEKLGEIDTVINNVNDFLSKYNKDKLSFDDDLRLMKLEIDNLRNSVEKNMSNTKENIKDELSDINAELVSLKSLIISKNAMNTETSNRKLAPVSSIPSASEILKKAKEKQAADSASKEVSSVSPPQSQPQTFPGRSSNVTKGNIFAAGIPEWQMKKKLEDEARERAKEEAEEEERLKLKKKEEENEQVKRDAGTPVPSATLPGSSGIPSWQQQGVPLSSSQSPVQAEAEAEASNPVATPWQSAASSGRAGGNQEEVEAAIANVGVPSWQLNANA